MTERRQGEIPDAIHDAAGEWLNRLQAGASPATERAFRSWMTADPRHAAAFEQIRKDWQLGMLLRDRAVGRNRSLPRAPFWMRQKVRAGAVGLGFAIALGLVTVSLLRPGGPMAWSSAAEAAVYETARGEIRTISLPDGSQAILDTASRLRVGFTSSDRSVALEAGRARFTTMADPRRPFRVQVPAGEVIARGTVFEISLIEKAPLVTAFEGLVQLQAGNAASAPRQLQAGQSMRLGDVLSRKTISARPDWVSGMLSVDHAPLGETIAAINRYNHVQLRLVDAALAQRRVTGAFRLRDPSGFADAVASSFGLRVRRAEDRIVLSAPPAPGR